MRNLGEMENFNIDSVARAYRLELLQSNYAIKNRIIAQGIAQWFESN